MTFLLHLKSFEALAGALQEYPGAKEPSKKL